MRKPHDLIGTLAAVGLALAPFGAMGCSKKEDPVKSSKPSDPPPPAARPTPDSVPPAPATHDTVPSNPTGDQPGAGTAAVPSQNGTGHGDTARNNAPATGDAADKKAETPAQPMTGAQANDAKGSDKIADNQAWERERTEFVETTRQRLKKLDARIAEMEALNAKISEPAQKEQAEKKIKALKERRDAAEKKLEEARTMQPDRWDRFKADMGTSLDRVEEGFTAGGK